MRLLTDENFDNDIMRGLLRLHAELDGVRVQDTEIYQAPDPSVLPWAAEQNRILLTHDVQTMISFAAERIAAELPMSGLIAVKEKMPIRLAIEQIEMILFVLDTSEFENQIYRVPF